LLNQISLAQHRWNEFWFTDFKLTSRTSPELAFGIGICQVALTKLDTDLVHLLPQAFELKLGVWLAMHENQRATPRCRAVFDGLAAGLVIY
jgi:hypothetical protein